jgi:hypothetical protein
MKTFSIIFTNLFGMTTMIIMAYGAWKILTGDVFGMTELTFLLFVCFIMTVLFGTSVSKEK